MAEATEPDEALREPAWLAELERRVHHAAREIASLRDRNAALVARIQGLEGDLEAERTARRTAAAAANVAAGASSQLALVPPSEAPPAVWDAERSEIRERVGRLVETLETLLAATADDSSSAAD